MSNFSNETYLRAKGYLGGVNVEKDLPCRECGYNLRGLEYGRKCPECGTTIERNKPVHQHLMDAPASYLRLLRIGMGLISVGLWSPVLALFVANVARQVGPLPILAMLLGGPVLFIVGGWIITRPKPHETLLSRPLTHIANITRAFLILTPLIVVATALNQLRSLDLLLSALASFFFFGEWALICYFFNDLARWAQDDILARRFEIILGSFAIIGVIDVIARLFGSTFLELTCLASLLLMAAVVWFFINVLVLFSTLNRAVVDKSIHDDSIFRNPSKRIK